MFKYAKPAEVGVSSKLIKKYLSILERYNLSTHDIIMARGNKIFFEKYYEPFNKDFAHRQYSVSKSVVSLAIGFLLQDGKISLDDKIKDYFKDDVLDETYENVKNQTIKDMLMMSTGHVETKSGYWFHDDKNDRVKWYFRANTGEMTISQFSQKPGTFFDYDSTGSFIMGALVERVSGKKFKEFMDEKLFSKLGISQYAKFFTCPGGHVWGDSAFLCTPQDMLKIARFTLNHGEIDGEQILSRDYLKDATSCLISTNPYGHTNPDGFGYGYQIWRTWNDSFFFNGLGCQFAICNPKTDIIFIYNGDNQANDIAISVVIDRFFEEIIDNVKDAPIKNDEENEKELVKYAESLKLRVFDGEKTTPIAEKINGKLFKMEKNRMGISELKLTFSGDGGVLYYKNEQGKKELPFGFGKNIFGNFPQEGYSAEIGGVSAPGNYYKCATSAGWRENNTLTIFCQIIDDYFGKLSFSICFRDENNISILLTSFGEAFFREYVGYADGSCDYNK